MAEQKRVIKKYPNRRLYDTSTSSYITLEDVKRLVLESVEISVVDAKTGDDLTRTVLLQIILEEESGGLPMFSYEVLTQIIRFYGHAMQGLMGSYLDKNMQMFAQMQQKLQAQTAGLTGTDNPMLQPALWNEFLKFQTPALQGMMSNYLDQSTNMFMEMQQKMQAQTQTMFGGFGFPVNPFAPAPASKEKPE